MKLTGIVVAVVAAASFTLTAAQYPLPQVDLGYEIHQAIGYNATGQYYNFSNIRFAQPPIGNLRWAHPVPPAGRNPVVQNGSQERICPQAAPMWSLIGSQFQVAFANGSADSFNYTNARNIAMASITAAQAQSANMTPDARINEDCLFLDVMVPKAAFDRRNQSYYASYTYNATYNSTYNSTNNRTRGAPVVLWIYGGGYTLGYKTLFGSPAGLIASSYGMSNSSEPIVYVAINYRLGAFGWLSGPSMQFDGGIANAALYDQRLAIQWVRERIHLFGGDPTRITLMGESAGGGSIMHQVTAYGGAKGVNFQQAIVQSPGWFPISSPYVEENITQSYFSLLNVSTLAEARLLNTTALMRANTIQVAGSAYGSYTYGPTVDGVFVTAQPGIAFGAGAYAKNISFMLGHNVNEGVYFAPSYVTTDAQLYDWVRSQYPYSAPQVTDYILNTLYPPNYDGRHNYTSPVTRAIRIVTEQIFTCNTNYIARAKANQTYNYEFQVPPAVHGQDIAYTFYNGAPTLNPLATTLQSFITNFAKSGNPNGAGLPTFPIQGLNASMLALNTTISIQRDDTANDRCRFWQKYLYT